MQWIPRVASSLRRNIPTVCGCWPMFKGPFCSRVSLLHRMQHRRTLRRCYLGVQVTASRSISLTVGTDSLFGRSTARRGNSLPGHSQDGRPLSPDVPNFVRQTVCPFVFMSRCCTCPPHTSRCMPFRPCVYLSEEFVTFRPHELVCLVTAIWRKVFSRPDLVLVDL